MADITPSATQIVIGFLLTGGGAKYAYDAWTTWRGRPSHILLKQGDVDASIRTVALARDELEADNARLRTTIAEGDEYLRSERAEWAKRVADQAARHAAERERWERDQERYRADIERLEKQIITERDTAQRAAVTQAARYDALLEQVRHLRRPPDQPEAR